MVHVIHRLLVLRNLSKVLRTLFDLCKLGLEEKEASQYHLELFFDLPPEIFPELLELLWERCVGEMRLDPILHRQLVEQAQREVVVL